MFRMVYIISSPFTWKYIKLYIHKSLCTHIIFQEGQSRNCIRWEVLWNRTELRETEGWSELIALLYFLYLCAICTIYHVMWSFTITKSLSFCLYSVCKVSLQLSPLSWLGTFPYLSYVIFKFENSRGLFPFTVYLLKCWTKLLSALIPENLTVYLFQ